MSRMTHDVFGQEINNGDFVVSGQRSGNSGELAMGVIKDAERFTRVSVGRGTTVGWVAGQIGRMGDYSRALKIPDEMLARCDKALFDKVNDIREGLKLPQNRHLKYQLTDKEDLERILASKL